MYVSVAGLPNTQLPPEGKHSSAAFGKTKAMRRSTRTRSTRPRLPGVLQAIADSDGTRAGVTKELFKVNIPNGDPRPVAFNENGDISPNPVTIYKAVNGQSTTYKVIVPSRSLVKKA